MAFVRVASLGAVRSRQARGRGVCVVVEGIEIGLFGVGADVHAMENTCPHADAPLSEGDIEGPVVTCPLHAWQLDVRTGLRPSDPDGFPLACFAVRVRGDDVEVDLDRVLNRRPRRGGAG